MFSNIFSVIKSDKQKTLPQEEKREKKELPDIFKTGLPIKSKNGFFWDIHKHNASFQLLQPFLPKGYEYMCDLELYDHLKRSGIISQVCIDNFVVKYTEKYPDKTKLILDMAYAASSTANANKRLNYIYEPSPMVSPEQTPSSLTKANIEALIAGIRNKTIKTDMDIVNKFGFQVYQHMKFHLYQFENVDLVDVSDRFIKNKSYFNGCVAHAFEVMYPNVTSHSGEYLFHGTTYYNMYSIMLNGLRSPKDSSRVQNASAYGVAIYTATHSSLSFQYCRQGNSQYGYSVMCIVQTNGKTVYSGGNIKTFKNDSDVTLRYVLFLTSHPSATYMDSLRKEFPYRQTKTKDELEEFDMDFNEDDIINIGDESDYMTLDTGEKIYIGSQEINETVDDDRPFIELEDGSKLYDQSDLVSEVMGTLLGDDKKNIVPQKPQEEPEEEIDIDELDLDLTKLIVDKDKVNLEGTGFNIDEEGRIYIQLNTGEKIYDDTQPKKPDQKAVSKFMMRQMTEKQKELPYIELDDGTRIYDETVYADIPQDETETKDDSTPMEIDEQDSKVDDTDENIYKKFTSYMFPTSTDNDQTWFSKILAKTLYENISS